MASAWILPALLLGPLLMAACCLIPRSADAVIRFCAVGTLVLAIPGAAAVRHAAALGPLFAAERWLMVDALSAYHLIILLVVFGFSALFAPFYFAGEIRSGRFGVRTAARYGALWFGTIGAMLLVVLSNNLALMWVGVEATTLLTAFLIRLQVGPAALEAMWKYLVMCSVGVALAFMGTLLAAASAGGTGESALLGTDLMRRAEQLNPRMIKAAFLFLVVGYGTKAGLAPMHNWLPDAHSQAPAPVSAVFSGFLLNTALYALLRYLPIVEAATGQAGWARGILVAFGLLSLVVAAGFLAAQREVKRLLAYSSIEHVGLMALGAGLGGVGAVAALFHALNHSLCKSVAFCCAGQLGRIRGTLDLRRLAGSVRVAPVWGTGLFVALLALIGAAPFAIFMSKFLIVKAAADAGRYGVMALALAGLAAVFISVLRHAVALAWAPADAVVAPQKTSIRAAALVALPLAAVLALGLWIPRPFAALLLRAARIIGGFG